MSIRFRKAWTSLKKLFEAAKNASEHLWIPTKFVIWQSTHDPIESLLNEPDASERRERTRLWRESKISELTTAAYTVSNTTPQRFHLLIKTFDDTAVGAYEQCGGWGIFLDIYTQGPMDHPRRLVQQPRYGAHLHHYVHPAEHPSASVRQPHRRLGQAARFASKQERGSRCPSEVSTDTVIRMADSGQSIER